MKQRIAEIIAKNYTRFGLDIENQIVDLARKGVVPCSADELLDAVNGMIWPFFDADVDEDADTVPQAQSLTAKLRRKCS